MKKSTIMSLCLIAILLAGTVSSAAIVQTGVDSYVINCDATQCGLLEYFPPAEVLNVQPGIWRMTPINPNIDPLATYMAFNYFSDPSIPDWAWGVGVFNLTTQQDLGGVGHGGFYPTPEAAYYVDPPSQPRDLVITSPSLLCFVIGDSYIADNLGGVSVRFERVPEPATLLLLTLGGLILRKRKV